MELQAMTKTQLIDKVEELSTNLEKSTINGAELKAKVFENEEIIGDYVQRMIVFAFSGMEKEIKQSPSLVFLVFFRT